MHICHVQSDFLHFNCTCIQLAVPTIIVVIFIYDNQTAYFIFYLKHSHVKFMLSEPFRGTKQAFSFFLFFYLGSIKNFIPSLAQPEHNFLAIFVTHRSGCSCHVCTTVITLKKNTKPTEIFQ